MDNIEKFADYKIVKISSRNHLIKYLSQFPEGTVYEMTLNNVTGEALIRIKKKGEDNG